MMTAPLLLLSTAPDSGPKFARTRSDISNFRAGDGGVKGEDEEWCLCLGRNGGQEEKRGKEESAAIDEYYKTTRN